MRLSGNLIIFYSASSSTSKKSPSSPAEIFQTHSTSLSSLVSFDSSAAKVIESPPSLSLPLTSTPMFLVLNLLLCGHFSQAARLHWSLQNMPQSMFTLTAALDRLRVDLDEHCLLPESTPREGTRWVHHVGKEERDSWKVLCEIAAEYMFEEL